MSDPEYAFSPSYFPTKSDAVALRGASFTGPPFTFVVSSASTFTGYTVTSTAKPAGALISCTQYVPRGTASAWACPFASVVMRATSFVQAASEYTP